MFCVKCGSPLAEDARFCSKCGAAVEEGMPQGTPAVQTGNGRQVVNRWLLLLFVVVLLVGGRLLYQKHWSPEAKIDAALERFVSSVSRCDFDGTLACFDSSYIVQLQGFKELFGQYVGADPYDALTHLLDKVASYAQKYGYTDGAPEMNYMVNHINLYSPDNADVFVTLILGKGSDAYVESKVLGMVRKDGNWYFNGKGFFW